MTVNIDLPKGTLSHEAEKAAKALIECGIVDVHQIRKGIVISFAIVFNDNELPTNTDLISLGMLIESNIRR